jgi:DNA-directed RNA polymerase sigma subunit (sigma70/sigma32)
VIHIPSYVWGNGRGATPERKQLAASAQSIRSLSATINESMGEINWGDTLVDDATPLASAIANEHTQSGNSKSRYLRGLIEQLPAQQQDVLRRRLHGEKLREIAEVYGVTRSRIQQIGENAKCRIKAMAKQQPFTED